MSLTTQPRPHRARNGRHYRVVQPLLSAPHLRGPPRSGRGRLGSTRAPRLRGDRPRLRARRIQQPARLALTPIGSSHLATEMSLDRTARRRTSRQRRRSYTTARELREGDARSSAEGPGLELYSGPWRGSLDCGNPWKIDHSWRLFSPLRPATTSLSCGTVRRPVSPRSSHPDRAPVGNSPAYIHG